MTGFGRGLESSDEVEIATEIRSVNHRFLDVSVRLPKVYSSFEPDVRRIVTGTIGRGKVDVSVSRNGSGTTLMDVALDRDLSRSYHQCLVELKKELGLCGDITISDMLTLPQIIVPAEKAEGTDKEWSMVEKSVRSALAALETMRQTEGKAMWEDIENRLRSIGGITDQFDPLVGQVTAAANERLRKRVMDLTGGMQLDHDRLLTETALIAERSDVTEEITRIRSHLDQFLSFGQDGSPIGRKLDFLLQELLRETNTIASKSASTEIAKHVVDMKAEVEKIREQTQNIE
jgi:uncharacterized protein (TIGR00255 family)